MFSLRLRPRMYQGINTTARIHTPHRLHIHYIKFLPIHFSKVLQFQLTFQASTVIYVVNGHHFLLRLASRTPHRLRTHYIKFLPLQISKHFQIQLTFQASIVFHVVYGLHFQHRLVSCRRVVIHQVTIVTILVLPRLETHSSHPPT